MIYPEIRSLLLATGLFSFLAFSAGELEGSHGGVPLLFFLTVQNIHTFLLWHRGLLIQRVSVEAQVQSLAQGRGLRIQRCHSCRVAPAPAQIQSLAQELAYAMRVAEKEEKKNTCNQPSLLWVTAQNAQESHICSRDRLGERVTVFLLCPTFIAFSINCGLTAKLSEGKLDDLLFQQRQTRVPCAFESGF